MTPKNQKRVVIITGANGGFGISFVNYFLGSEDIVLALDINSSNLDEVNSENPHAENLYIFNVDISDYQQLNKIAEDNSHLLKNNPIILLNAAGIFKKTPAIIRNDERIRQIINSNLIGTMYCMEIFCHYMIKQRCGNIINIASVAGIHGTALASAYAASKAGLIAATKSYAREVAPYGISVNTIAPGFCDTDMLKADKAMVESTILPHIPTQRIGDAADVLECVQFLANCRTDYLTGSVITIDGGLHVG